MRHYRAIIAGLVMMTMFGLISISSEDSAASASPRSAVVIPSLQGSLQDYPLASWLFNRFSSRLSLTSEQKEEIKSILVAEIPVVQPLIKKLRENRQDILTATQDGHFDASRVRPIAKRQGAILAELIVIKEQVKSEIYAVLTPEQQEQLQEVISSLEDTVRKWLKQ